MENTIPTDTSRRTFLQSLLVGAYALTLAGCGGGDHDNSSRFDTTRATKLVTDYQSAYNVLGLSVAVVRGSRLLWSSGFGTANKELGRKVTTETAFLTASISKTVVAVAAMQLVERGKLALDADINTYLPFPVRNPKYPDTPITLRQLLAHVSGISDAFYGVVSPNYFEGDANTEHRFFYEQGDPRLTLADFCREFFVPGGANYDPSTYSANAPGTVFEYSNMGATLVGYIIERAAGEEFAAYTKRTIFAPLGMSRTSWRVADFRAEDLAMPYSATGEPYGNYTFADYPDGALRTTPSDLSRYLRMFIGNGVLDGKRIVSAASVAEMKRNQFPAVDTTTGLLWDRGPVAGFASLLGHSGAESGAFSEMRYNEATGTGFIFCQNQLQAVNTDPLTQVESAYVVLAELLRLGEAA